ncbi:MAG: hypothetical protein KHY44_16970 [Clostridiales bacterium]|jgi:fucose permease|nr:hypothetical protein [Clostridiales bacterium]
MVVLMYLSIFIGFIFPAAMIQAIKKAINKENYTEDVLIACICSGIIIATLILTNS